jgi:hypothetical protein
MKYYIEAYYSDDTPILGNCDGQGILYAKQYKRTDHYKELLKSRSTRVSYYLILRASDREIMERINVVSDTNSHIKCRRNDDELNNLFIR